MENEDDDFCTGTKLENNNIVESGSGEKMYLEGNETVDPRVLNDQGWDRNVNGTTILRNCDCLALAKSIVEAENGDVQGSYEFNLRLERKEEEVATAVSAAERVSHYGEGAFSERTKSMDIGMGVDELEFDPVLFEFFYGTCNEHILENGDNDIVTSVSDAANECNIGGLKHDDGNNKGDWVNEDGETMVYKVQTEEDKFINANGDQGGHDLDKGKPGEDVVQVEKKQTEKRTKRSKVRGEDHMILRSVLETCLLKANYPRCIIHS